MNDIDFIYNWDILLIIANWRIVGRNISQDLDYPGCKLSGLISVVP